MLIFFLLATTGLSIDSSNFKTCGQTGFCKRNRYVANRLDGGERTGLRFSMRYHVDPNSIQRSEQGIKFLIKSEFESAWRLQGTLSVFESEIVRFTVVEIDPLYPRYKVPDQDLISPKEVVTDFTSAFQADTYREFGYKRLKVRVGLSPLRVDVFRNDSLCATLNHRSLFSFERYRQRDRDLPMANELRQIIDASEVIYEDQGDLRKPDDLWSERFKTFTDVKRRGPSSVALDVHFPGTSQLYGLPEHSDSVKLSDTLAGEPYRLFNLDVFEYEVESRQALYGSVAFLLAKQGTRATGLFWNNPSDTYVDIGTSPPDKQTHWMSEAGVIDVFVVPSDSLLEAVSKFTLLTGPTAMPALSSLGFHQCRWNYNDQQDVLEVAGNFDRNNLPVDYIWLDIDHTKGRRYFTWDLDKFPSPIEMQKTLALHSRSLVTIIDPHIKRDDSYYVYSEAKSDEKISQWLCAFVPVCEEPKKSCFIKTYEGNDYEGHCWPGSSSWLDFLQPEVREYWADLLSLERYEHSTQSLQVWNDMNEPSVFSGPEVTMHGDALHGDFEHREVHNIYGQYMHRSTSEGLFKRGTQRPFVLTRAFYAGSQKFGAVWTGDNTAKWSFLKASVPMCLSIAVSGISFCGADVGGFFGNPSQVLLVRWHQLGVFLPFMRAHAHIESKRREPWMFGEPTLTHIREALHLRYSLLPYLYTAFYLNHVAGTPVIKPLFMEFPNDPECEDLDSQFLLGGLMVVPVVEERQRKISVYLPNAVWYDFYEWNKVMPGRLEAKVVPERIPVYVKGGTILFRQERLRRSSELMKNDPYSIYIALDSKYQASGQLYLDDGHSNDFKKGEFSLATLSFNTNSATFKVEGAFSKPNLVDKIVIAGLPMGVLRVTVLKDDAQWQAGFYKFSEFVTVKLPGVHVDEQWRLKIDFEN